MPPFVLGYFELLLVHLDLDCLQLPRKVADAEMIATWRKLTALRVKGVVLTGKLECANSFRQHLWCIPCVDRVLKRSFKELEFRLRCH